MSPVRKEACFIQLHSSFEKVQCFSIPLKTMEESLKETHLLPNDMVPLQAGNIPVPYVACFSIYSRLFHMQNSCQTVQYPMHQSNIPWKSCKAKMTMLLAHSSFPIRLHSILVKKPCSCKKKLDTWNIPVEKAHIPVEKAQSSLFVVSKNPFTFWGTISFIQYERLVLSS